MSVEHFVKFIKTNKHVLIPIPFTRVDITILDATPVIWELGVETTDLFSGTPNPAMVSLIKQLLHRTCHPHLSLRKNSIGH